MKKRTRFYSLVCWQVFILQNLNLTDSRSGSAIWADGASTCGERSRRSPLGLPSAVWHPSRPSADRLRTPSLARPPELFVPSLFSQPARINTLQQLVFFSKLWTQPSGHTVWNTVVWPMTSHFFIFLIIFPLSLSFNLVFIFDQTSFSEC